MASVSPHTGGQTGNEDKTGRFDHLRHAWLLNVASFWSYKLRRTEPKVTLLSLFTPQLCVPFKIKQSLQRIGFKLLFSVHTLMESNISCLKSFIIQAATR